MKGDQDIKSAEQGNLALQTKLSDMLGTQFGKQSGILDMLTKKLTATAENPQGFSPQQLTAARSAVTEGTATDYASALKATQAGMAARGGPGVLPSGIEAQTRAQLAGMGAQEQATGQRGITIANEQQRQQNMWNAISGLSGTASQFNPLGYAGGATGAGESVGSLGTAYKQSQQSGWLNALAGGIGGAATSWASGGFKMPGGGGGGGGAPMQPFGGG